VRRINILISALALAVIIWSVCFAVTQEHRRTPDFLQQKYQELNRTFFENSLPTARLEWADLTDADAAGQTFLESDDSFVIQVDRRSDFWDDDDLQDTVKHETCHIATWGAEEEEHGPIFQRCMARIKAHSK
jgi:predicted SprT family Zn-dependent metalloprotease